MSFDDWANGREAMSLDYIVDWHGWAYARLAAKIALVAFLAWIAWLLL